MLNDSSLKDGVALLLHVLELLKGLFELLYVCIVDSLSFEHLGEQVVELIALKSLIVVQNCEESGFLWT